MHLLGTDVLQRESERLLTTVVDGELVAMSVEEGACYGLNAIGTRIWELLADPRSVDSLCEQLTREFEVDDAVCRREVLAFLEQLRKEGIVSVTADGRPGPAR
jgi:hypothetical protein